MSTPFGRVVFSIRELHSRLNGAALVIDLWRAQVRCRIHVITTRPSVVRALAFRWDVPLNLNTSCSSCAVKAVPRSVITATGAPCRSTILVRKNCASASAVRRVSAFVSAHLVKLSMATTIHFFPVVEVGKGPSKFMPTCSKGVLYAPERATEVRLAGRGCFPSLAVPASSYILPSGGR